MGQLALFAVPPSLADLSDHSNYHDAYQRFLMAEQFGDGALLAWAKAYARPAMEALFEAHDVGFESPARDDEEASEIASALLAASKDARELATDVAGDLRSIVRDIRKACDEQEERARLLDHAADRLGEFAELGDAE